MGSAAALVKSGLQVGAYEMSKDAAKGCLNKWISFHPFLVVCRSDSWSSVDGWRIYGHCATLESARSLAGKGHRIYERVENGQYERRPKS